MEKYVGKLLDKRYEDYNNVPKDKRSKAVTDLVLQAYLLKDSDSIPDKLDPEFGTFATRQIRMFVFVGHDSTRSTICYFLHLLSKNPDALARLCAEHDSVYKADISAVSSLFISKPHLIKTLPYTNAVSREVLRLFPPANVTRQGKKNVHLTDEQGNVCPTEGALAFPLHIGMQRSPEYWYGQTSFFQSGGWSSEDTSSFLRKMHGGPFEFGPRDCFAEGVVMAGIKLVWYTLPENLNSMMRMTGGILCTRDKDLRLIEKREHVKWTKERRIQHRTTRQGINPKHVSLRSENLLHGSSKPREMFVRYFSLERSLKASKLVGFNQESAH